MIFSVHERGNARVPSRIVNNFLRLYHRPVSERTAPDMMALIFATLLIALTLAWTGHGRVAVAAILSCLLLSVGEFLWEVYSPEYGFRMPWIQVQFAPALLRAGFGA